MRRALALAALVVAGCGGAADDACAGHASECLGLRVVGAGVSTVDRLQIAVSGAAQLDGQTPPDGPRAPIALPVTTALYLPDASGDVTVEVTGLLAGVAVGHGATRATIAPGTHQTVTVTLTPPGGPDAGAPDQSPNDLSLNDSSMNDLSMNDLSMNDLSMNDLSMNDLSMNDLSMNDLSMNDLSMSDFSTVDLSMNDLSMSDLSMSDLSMNDLSMSDLSMSDLSMNDLSTVDLSMNDLAKPDLSFPDLSFPDLARPDLSFPDLSFPDLVQLPPRRIFVTPMVKGDMTFMGNTGTSAADAECALIAGGGSWKAILGTGNGQPPSQYIKLPNGTRPIVLPSGKQVATDATFFSAVHLAPINETWAMGQVNNGECVWTGFLTDGSNDGANDCSLWTDSANSNGGTGIASNMDSTWAVKFAQFCGQTCHVYCIEQ